ncbi:MAG: Clp protease ClpP [Burkholderiales bacterium]|nr:Clp protease ClpP [Burkholderiales bacterium]
MQRIIIFGDIGQDTTSEGVKSQLAQVPRGSRPVVEINSDGGSVQEAVAIYNTLRTWPGGVDVEIIGWALSAASVIAMAGRTIRIHETSLLMLHAPWVSMSGNEHQLRERADLLGLVAQTMRLAYARSRQPDAVLDSWLDGADHWMTADQALAVGLVDEVITSNALAAAPIDVRACRFTVPPSLTQRIHAMPAPSNTPQPTEAEIRAAAQRDESARQSDIRAAFAPHASKIDGAAALLEACLKDPKVDVQAAKARLLDLKAVGVEPLAGNHFARDPRDPNGNDEPRMADFRAAATDVLLMRAGIKVAEPHPAARDLQRYSVLTMAERVLSMHGRSTRDLSRTEIITAALTTSDFPGLLSNVSGKALRAGYESAPSTFVGWTGEREVLDFKTQSLVALSEAPALLKVLEASEYKYGKLDDSNSTFTVETYGRILRISRQALINDDTQAFTTLPQAYGAAARRLEADLVYAKLTANANLSDGVALFHATHGNLSAAGVPSLATLGIARAAMRVQKGLQGLGYVDPQPRYLIVPVALETSCEQLLSSLVDPSKSNDTPNVEWVRGLTLVSDPRLDAVSATQWYLSAAPAQIEGIVRAYLQGEDRPGLYEQEIFDRDVTEFKARLDVGAGVIDYRALHRNG